MSFVSLPMKMPARCSKAATILVPDRCEPVIINVRGSVLGRPTTMMPLFSRLADIRGDDVPRPRNARYPRGHVPGHTQDRPDWQMSTRPIRRHAPADAR